jgi:hypothetical protein
MAVRNSVGRPPKFNLKIVNQLADSISHNYNITDSCKYAGVSRTLFYRHLNNNELFAKEIAEAKENRNKVNFNFVTVR